MKKWIYISACLTISAVLLTGCGNNQVSTDEIKAAIQESIPTISQLSDGPTSITFKNDNDETINYTVTEEDDQIKVSDENGKTICTFSVNDFSK